MSVNSTNPSELFGGTWVSWVNGRVPIGVGSNGTTNYTTPEITGGSTEHRHDWRIGMHWWYGSACGEGVSNGTSYFYMKNLQGDIVGITDTPGDIVAKYTYNSWGKMISVKDANDVDKTTFYLGFFLYTKTLLEFLVTINPF